MSIPSRNGVKYGDTFLTIYLKSAFQGGVLLTRPESNVPIHIMGNPQSTLGLWEPQMGKTNPIEKMIVLRADLYK